VELSGPVHCRLVVSASCRRVHLDCMAVCVRVCVRACGITDTGLCCPEGSQTDGQGACCPSGIVDACGKCDGTGVVTDARGVCCSTPLPPSGLCCVEGVDSCGVCGGTSFCSAVVMATNVSVTRSANMTSADMADRLGVGAAVRGVIWTAVCLLVLGV
jgi:hypothetical protein